MLRLLLLTIISLICSPNLFAAPIDFNNDGLSDASVVEVGEGLKWLSKIKGQTTTVADSFGEEGNHLAAARYSGNKSQVAFINNFGIWTILVGSTQKSIALGEDNAVYIAGGDYNGDDLADAAYATNACSNSRSRTKFITDPLNNEVVLDIATGRGLHYKTFADINADGRDEICFATPNKSKGKFDGKFTLKCKDILTNERIARINIGRIFDQPLPLKITGDVDHIVLSRQRKGRTIIRIYRLGKQIKKFKFSGTGIITIGNYTNENSQQIALVKNSNATVYDLDADDFENISFPNGIAYDHININTFNTAENCFCNTKKINQSGSCTGSGSGGGSGGGGNNTPNIPIGDGNCEVQRDITDGPNNWLHKPVSESTGNVVNLLSTSDHPADCRYERSNGDLFRDAFLASFSNPNRPTWRPEGGGRCSDFPKPLVFACTIRGQKNCWTVPDPCTRYD